MKTWRLNRTKQCKNCPWKVESDLSKIPNYQEDLHKGLSSTIADQNSCSLSSTNVMACHHSKEGQEEHCIGWLVNQLGVGNNIGMRLRMSSCENSKDIEVFGEQYQNFEDTIERP